MSFEKGHRMIGVMIFSAGILLALGPSFARAEHPDFSGRWILDLGKSKLHPVISKDLTAGIFIIDHKEPSFRLHREFTQAGKLDTLDVSLKSDGVETKGTDSGMQTLSTLRWEGDTLIYLTIYQAPRGEARNNVVYRILDDGNTLRAEESFRGPRLSYDNVWIFTKSR